MTTWLILATYIVIWLLYGWRLTVHLLDAEVRRAMYAYDSAEDAARNWLGITTFGAFGLALFWPVVAPIRFAYRLMSAGGLFRTPVEREEAERRELDALRKLAKEHNLPMPGDQ